MRFLDVALVTCLSAICSMACADDEQEFLKEKQARIDGARPGIIAPTDSPIHWLTDLKVAQEQSRSTGKPLFVLVTSPRTCGPCRAFEKEVKSSPEAIAAINDQCIPVYVDTEDAPAFFPAEYIAQAKVVVKELETPQIPTFVITDSELRPFVRHVGFKDEKKFFAWLNSNVNLVTANLALLQGSRIEEVSDPILLDRFMALMTDSELRIGWIGTMQQLVTKSQGVSPEIHNKWSKVLPDLQGEQLSIDLEEFAAKALAQGKSPEEVIALIDQELTQAGDHPSVQCVLLCQKGKLYLGLEQLENAYAPLQTAMTLKGLSPQRQKQAMSQLVKTAVDAGEYDRAESFLAMYFAPQQFPTQEARASAIDLNMAKFLVNYVAVGECRREEEAYMHLRRGFANRDRANDFEIMMVMSHLCSILGTGDDLRGELMLNFAEGMSKDERAASQRIQTGLWAALCFQAAGDEANAQKALAFVESVSAPIEGRAIPVKNATGTRLESLKYLSRSCSQGPARARYLIQAAFAAKAAGQAAEAEALATQAQAEMKSFEGKGSKSARQAVEELISQWKAAQSL